MSIIYNPVNNLEQIQYDYAVLVDGILTYPHPIVMSSFYYRQDPTNIIISDNVISCHGAFRGMMNINANITIPDSVLDCVEMFKGCRNLHRPVIIPDSVTNCYGMFDFCTTFNNSVTIGQNVLNCASMFSNCIYFNQPITIPSKVTNCVNMFSACSNFNQTITIPDNVINCSGVLSETERFNSAITIGKNVINCSGLLGRGYNFGNHIYFKTKSTSIDITGLFYTYAQKKYIHFNSALNSKFNSTTAAKWLTPRGDVTWTTMTNGFYNTAYNVYCYYNYAP